MDSNLVQYRDEQAWVWENLHGGSGAISVRRYFEGKLKWPIELELWEIPVGGSEGVHRHGEDDPDGYALVDECYVVVSGRARLTFADTVAEVGPGDAFLAGPVADRGIENIGDEPLRLVVISDVPVAT